MKNTNPDKPKTITTTYLSGKIKNLTQVHNETINQQKTANSHVACMLHFSFD